MYEVSLCPCMWVINRELMPPYLWSFEHLPLEAAMSFHGESRWNWGPAYQSDPFPLEHKFLIFYFQSDKSFADHHFHSQTKCWKKCLNSDKKHVDISHLTFDKYHSSFDIQHLKFVWHLTFEIWHLTFKLWHLFEILHFTFDIQHWTLVISIALILLERLRVTLVTSNPSMDCVKIWKGGLQLRIHYSTSSL